jgi:fermentation-respiration switch protein FrsA (DUF1100 family)
MANAAEKRPLDEHRARRLRKWVLRAGACLALLVVLGVVGAYVAGNWLTAPAYTAVGAPPGDTGWRDARFEDDTGVQLRGWFGEGEPGRGAIILLHSIRADRRQMLRRARFLQAKGLAVLLFDLQAHGESGGTAITFGVREARSAAAALEYVRKRLPEERVAVIGTSLGGAACLLGDGPVSADAMILEGVYSTVERAIENRLKMQFGRLGALGTPMLTCQLPLRLGIRAAQLRPVDAIRRVRCPVLVMGGTRDEHTVAEETRSLFDAAPEPKELWMVEGAGHVDLYDYAGAEYERRILAFLGKYLEP